MWLSSLTFNLPYPSRHPPRLPVGTGLCSDYGVSPYLGRLKPKLVLKWRLEQPWALESQSVSSNLVLLLSFTTHRFTQDAPRSPPVLTTPHLRPLDILLVTLAITILHISVTPVRSTASTSVFTSRDIAQWLRQKKEKKHTKLPQNSVFTAIC